jgi:predicted RNase H-like nuclease (RuvC/YqgF family)
MGMAAAFTWQFSSITSELETLKKAPQQVSELEKKVTTQEFEVREIKNTIKDMDRRSQESLEINKKVQEELRVVSERMLQLTIEQEQQRREWQRRNGFRQDDFDDNRNQRRNR